MPLTVQALGIFLVLLPGFASVYLTQQLSFRPKQSELDKVVEALLLSLVLYVLVIPFFGFALPVGWHAAGTSGNLGSYVVVAKWKELAVLALAAVLLGILYAANLNHDWALKLFRKAHVTKRTSRTSIWGDVFQEIGGTVQVGLADGRSVMGWVRHYSDDPSDSLIFLAQAAWIDESDGLVPIEGPGILLLREAQIQYVMFLNAANVGGASTSN